MKRIPLCTHFALTLMLCVLGAHAQQDGNFPPPATITGSGTTNYIPRWTGSTTLGNSKLYQTGGMIGIGTTAPTVLLDVNGRINAAKSYRMAGQDLLYKPGNPGTENLGVGFGALQSSGATFANTAVGDSTLNSLTTGHNNTAVGASALAFDLGDYNTAVGSGALSSNTNGASNVGLGVGAMFDNTTGNQNTALGDSALNTNTTGSSNIAIGFQAAIDVANGNSNNIHIGNTGQSADNNTIRIGDIAIQTAFFVGGVSGVPTGVNDAVPVLIDNHGQLGTLSSSRRFKENIQDMGDGSLGLLRLRPVTFRYKKSFDDGTKPLQYGLVAEEVAEVYPDLVTHSADGQVQAVKYQVLDSMLLNEVQRQQREIRRLTDRLEKMEAALAAVTNVRE